MTERNKQNNEDYNKLQKIIRPKIRKANAQWIKTNATNLKS